MRLPLQGGKKTDAEVEVEWLMQVGPGSGHVCMTMLWKGCEWAGFLRVGSRDRAEEGA